MWRVFEREKDLELNAVRKTSSKTNSIWSFVWIAQCFSKLS